VRAHLPCTLARHFDRAAATGYYGAIRVSAAGGGSLPALPRRAVTRAPPNVVRADGPDAVAAADAFGADSLARQPREVAVRALPQDEEAPVAMLLQIGQQSRQRLGCSVHGSLR
jgi:hypothetical protein